MHHVDSIPRGAFYFPRLRLGAADVMAGAHTSHRALNQQRKILRSLRVLESHVVTYFSAERKISQISDSGSPARRFACSALIRVSQNFAMRSRDTLEINVTLGLRRIFNRDVNSLILNVETRGIT